MIMYQVTLKTPQGDYQIPINERQSIFEGAQENEIELPIFCHVGSCSVCTGKLLSGNVDQEAQSFLCEDEINAGFILTCVAKPTSNCVVVTHQEDSLY